MITVCTVSKQHDDFLEIYLESIKSKSSLISKVLVCHNSEGEQFHYTQQIGTIEVEHFGYKSGLPDRINEHAFSLHRCLEKCQTDLVLFCDPDIFFYLDNFDEYYLKLMERYNLKFIGVRHYRNDESYRDFPCVFNLLTKKSYLPPHDWLKGYLRARNYFYLRLGRTDGPIADGKFLACGPIPEFADKFPYRKGLFDTGCNLWLWNQENNGRYISFGMEDPRRYVKYPYASNFDLTDNLGTGRILYHCTKALRGQKVKQNTVDGFKKAFQDFQSNATK